MKKTKQRILTTLLIASIVFSMMITAAPVVKAATSGDYQYTINNGKATIIKYTGAGGDVKIPNTLGGYSVTGIEPDKSNIMEQYNMGFSNCTSITIPDSVTFIGDYAFYRCTYLKNITIPSSVKSIGISGFDGCSELTNITITDGITSIGEYAFKECIKLTSITIPSTVTNLGALAFGFCNNLKSVIFKGNAPKMGVDVFYGATNNFKIHYIEGSIGFSNPWNGYKTTTSTATTSSPVIPIAVVAIIITIGALIFMYLRKNKKKKSQLNEIGNSNAVVVNDDEIYINKFLSYDPAASNIWTCECGTKNEADAVFCGNCGVKK